MLYVAVLELFWHLSALKSIANEIEVCKQMSKRHSFLRYASVWHSESKNRSRYCQGNGKFADQDFENPSRNKNYQYMPDWYPLPMSIEYIASFSWSLVSTDASRACVRSSGPAAAFFASSDAMESSVRRERDAARLCRKNGPPLRRARRHQHQVRGYVSSERVCECVRLHELHDGDLCDGSLCTFFSHLLRDNSNEGYWRWPRCSWQCRRRSTLTEQRAGQRQGELPRQR